MQENFDLSLKYVLVSEGGYSNHPNDPGGPTNLGITQAELGKWIGHPASIAEVKALTRQTAAIIYKANYWKPMKADEMPAGVDYLLFDFGVNAGNYQAIKTLQRCLGVSVDGKFGPITMAAALARMSKQLILDYTDAKEAFYRGLACNRPKLAVFLGGWLDRCRDVQKHAIAMNAGHGEVPHTGPVGNAKAMVLPDKIVAME